MRTNISFLQKRQRLLMGSARGPNTPVLLKWTEITGGTVDPLSGGFIGGTSAEKTKTVRGFVHFVDISSSSVRQFSEIEHGDAIVDLPPSTVLEGLLDLRFEIAGEDWVQKEVGKKLATSWDVLVQGTKLFRPILLRKQT